MVKVTARNSRGDVVARMMFEGWHRDTLEVIELYVSVVETTEEAILTIVVDGEKLGDNQDELSTES